MGRSLFAFWCSLLFVVFASSSLFGEDKATIIRGVEGYGTSRQLALADAFRNAISRALGTYVVTSRQWDGETLDKKIFDNSDAVVKTHRVVGENETGDRWSVTIDAEIVQNEMMKYIRKEATSEIGEGELANFLAKRNAINNAVQSLDLLFQNWRENIYRVEKYGSLTVAAEDDTAGDTVHVSVPFVITFRWDAYAIFLGKVRNVLSRIAIDKTQGEYDKSEGQGFLDKNFRFYERVGLAMKKGAWTERSGNPNNYGEVRIVSYLSDSKFRYEIYVVPNQVKQKLDSLLQRESEVRFTFTSKGGDVVGSQLISGEIYSYGWWWIADDDVVSWSSPADGFQLLTIMDRIKTEFDYRTEWSLHRLYHASIPIPLDDAARISGCVITVCQRSEQQCYVKGKTITSETINAEEWGRLDKRPKVVARKESSSPKRREPQQKESLVDGPPRPEPEPIERIVVSENDKKLKERVLELCSLPPDVPCANKWFKLAKEVESNEMRQTVLKAVASALVCAKRADIYNTKIRNQIQDAPSLEVSFCRGCPDCNGTKMREKPCTACRGRGACCYANCRGGAHLVRKIQGSRYEKCSKCKGTGICQNCGGSGKERTRCRCCMGKGKVFSSDAAAQTYHKLVECISMSFQ